MLRIFGLKKGEETGEWKLLHYEELNDIYFLSNIILVAIQRRMRWAEHVALGGKSFIQGFGGEPCRKETSWKTLV